MKSDGFRRWHDGSQFKGTWADRNRSMFNLLSHLNLKDMSFVEWGCGPNRPFVSQFAQYFKSFIASDTKDWGDGCLVCDLNESDNELPKTDISVLSGVVEYLSNPKVALERISRSSSYILLSYMYINPPSRVEDVFRRIRGTGGYIDQIRERCVINGNRNHYSLSQFLELISQYGYIDNIDQWGGHVIVLVKVFD